MGGGKVGLAFFLFLFSLPLQQTTSGVGHFIKLLSKENYEQHDSSEDDKNILLRRFPGRPNV